MDELDELQEELVGVRAEVERLTDQLADREARALDLTETQASLRREVAAARGEAAQARTAAAEEGHRLAAQYRTVLLQTAPDVPPDLVQGESVEDLDRALNSARELVARVREQVQAQSAARIPTGSPARTGTDFSALSPGEKIRAGIAERQ